MLLVSVQFCVQADKPCPPTLKECCGLHWAGGARHVCATLCRDPEQKKPKGEGPVGNTISDPVMLDRYVAIADYVKQETNQCSLEAGQVVEVVEKNQHGRWVGPAGGGAYQCCRVHTYIHSCTLFW